MLVSKVRKKELKQFCKKIGLKFRNLQLLNMAFSHTSYVFENKVDRNESYERLEFLGDAVLKLSISDILYSTYPDKSEGQLSEQRAIIVSDRTISTFANKIGMSELILVGKCENTKGKKKQSILACAFEALLGAIYLQFKNKGYIRAKEFLINNFKEEILNIKVDNPKADLQEFTQKYNHNLPEYVVMEEKGPAHCKTFVIGVYYENKFIDKAEAQSKKEAECEVAKKALAKLKEIYGGD